MGRGGVERTGGAPAVIIRDRTGMMDGPERGGLGGAPIVSVKTCLIKGTGSCRVAALIASSAAV